MTDEITLDAPETPLERFLAAAAGVEGITLDEPVTRIEKYLYKIAQGSGGVPAVEDADKGKYLHANESTGALEWAEGGSGGGVLVVNDVGRTLDKTWQEIHDAFPFAYISIDTTKFQITGIISPDIEGDPYSVILWDGEAEVIYYTASASGYPASV